MHYNCIRNEIRQKKLMFWNHEARDGHKGLVKAKGLSWEGENHEARDGHKGTHWRRNS